VLESRLSLGFFVAAALHQASPTPAPAAATSETCCGRKTRARDASGPLPTDRKSVLLRALGEKIRRSDAPLYGEGALASLPDRIAALPADAPVQQLFPLRFALADALLSQGHLDRAIEQLEECRKLANAAHDPESAADVTHWVALA